MLRAGLVVGIVAGTVMVAGCASTPPPTTSAISVPGGWPLPDALAVVTSSFAEPRGRRHHLGLDLAAPKGTAVLATAAGEVTFADRSGDWGRLVVIEHGGGWETRYAHLSRIRVDRGDLVARGTEIGTVGRTGNATGYHLHYEVRHADQPLDPWPTLRR
jgi:murein DD-endopeptidase MepM/ murein hydrolase activator NlpD